VKRKQPTLAATFTRTTPYGADNDKVTRLNRLLVALICKEGLPFNLVESPHFKAFVNELDPRYVLPTRRCLSDTLIPARYNETMTEMQASIAAAEAHAVTTDLWTSSANHAYMGVTAHWLDAGFVPHNSCLAVRPAPGSHTAEYISSELKSVLDEWSLGLQPNKLHVVTDSGANVKKAIAQLPAVKWRACFAHTLQLCVNTGLSSKEVSDLPKVLSKARAIVGHFRRSPLATTELQKAQNQLNLPEHKLLQDCATRWNSQVGINVKL